MWRLLQVTPKVMAELKWHTEEGFVDGFNDLEFTGG